MAAVRLPGDSTVEHVTGRMTTGKSALTGAATGAWFGLFIGLLFAIFTVGPLWIWALLIALPAIGQRVTGDGGRADGPGEPAFQDAYQRLARLGLPLRPYEPAWDQLRRLRSAYLPHLLVATELLLVSREFRNQAGPDSA